MELKDLAGRHKFSGVDYTPEAVLFCLDGITYFAEEDPDDGYRSYLRELKVSDTPCKNTFPEEDVICEHKDSYDGYGHDDILIIKNPQTRNVILKIGTADVDDYYPTCVMEYRPENMRCNLQ